MIDLIIQDAIRNVIGDEFIKRFKLPDDKSNHSYHSKILAVCETIAAGIYNNRQLSINTIAYRIQECECSWSVAIKTALKIVAKLKTSEYYKYVTEYETFDEEETRLYSIDFKLDDYQKTLDFGSYKMRIYDIVKLQYNMSTTKRSRKYSMLSETLKRKMQRIIDRMHSDRDDMFKHHHDKLRIQKLDRTLNYIDNQYYSIDKVRNFTINLKGEMTCLPKGKPCKTVVTEEQGTVWSKNYRQTIKYGKGVRAIFNQEGLPPTSMTDIQDISQSLKAAYTFVGDIQVVEGEDIRLYYHYDQYANDNTESLGNSCMRHDSCQEFFDIYVDNPDKVKMAIAKTPDGIIGRALLWTTDCGTKVMDRIYGNEITINGMKAWAHANSYIHKKVQSYSNDTDFVTTVGEIITGEYKITLERNNDYMPYMDTFKYSDDQYAKQLVITNDSCYDNYTFDATDGGEAGGTLCVNGERYNDDDVCYIEYGSVEEGYYHNDDTFYCDWSDMYYHENDMVRTRSGDTVYNEHNDLVYMEHYDQYEHCDDVVFSDQISSYILTEDSVKCIIKGDILKSQSCEITLNGLSYTVHEDVTTNELEEFLS